MQLGEEQHRAALRAAGGGGGMAAEHGAGEWADRGEGAFKKSLRLLNKALAAAPSRASVRLALARLLSHPQVSPRARARAPPLRPRPRPRGPSARVRAAQGPRDLVQAYAHVAAARAAEPESAEVLLASARFEAGVLGDLDTALEAAEAARARAPSAEAAEVAAHIHVDIAEVTPARAPAL